MTTFSNQGQLPSLPVPDLARTLDKYITNATLLLSEKDTATTKAIVEKWRQSRELRELQTLLEKRAQSNRNWLETWWNEMYMDIRTPLVPFLSFATKNSNYLPRPGSQLHRAADMAYNWMLFWQMIRREEIPVFASRGVKWDMIQYHHLFNSTRVADLPRDRMARFFKTETEGSCPSHIVVSCRGNLWKMEMLRNGKIKSPSEIYKMFNFIKENSQYNENGLQVLTTLPRDDWAKIRSNIETYSNGNKGNLLLVEQAVVAFGVSDDIIPDHKQLLSASMLGEPDIHWADKSLNIVSYGDGQGTIQGEHSNVDAIVTIHADDWASARVRDGFWNVEDVPFDAPLLLKFDLSDYHKQQIQRSKIQFEKLKTATKVDVVKYNAYGNALLKSKKIYTDTVIQLALQLAFAKVHGKCAPIYETASTRRFYHGRTETVRGRTRESVQFIQAVLQNQKKENQQRLFKAAYDAHNTEMSECVQGKGIDRHLMGLRKIHEELNSSGRNKTLLPEIYNDKAWTHSGGGGNFLLSTSFVGYIDDDEKSDSGKYCSAMCAGGYGTFYQIGNKRLVLSISDFPGTSSDLKAYGEAIHWALDHIGSILNLFQSQL